MSDTLLANLQADIAARIAADDVLAGIPVVTERSGDILSIVGRSLGLVKGGSGKRGLCVVVLQMSGRTESDNLPNPTLQLQPVVRVMEQPLLNTGGELTALSVARRILRILHHYTPGGIASALIADNPAIIGVEDPIAPLAYDCQFYTFEADPGVYCKVTSPSIWPDEGAATAASPITVSMGCDTDGAAIWYTTNGSPPVPESGQSARYSEPFAIDGPCLIRAAAYLPGSIASDTVAVQFD